MTASTHQPKRDDRKSLFAAPTTLTDQSVSVVVPVRDNPAGIRRLLDSISALDSTKLLEVIVVDDGSKTELGISNKLAKIPVRVIRISGSGPASARNRGIYHSRGNWLLFLDSDCVVTSDILREYELALDGSIAYAGHVAAVGEGWLARYYDSVKTLIPTITTDSVEPSYIVTANALVWAKAAKQVGGFDKRFQFAGGEDVDFGFRLGDIGKLAYAPTAVVHHDFGTAIEFCRRSFRYGRAHAIVANKHEFAGWASLRQEPSMSASRLLDFINQILVSSGYLSEKALSWIYRRNT